MARTNLKYTKRYTMRNDLVLLRRTIEKVGGLVMPDLSSEGKVYTVIGMGPKVENLEIGDVIFLFAEKGDPFFNIPEEEDLLSVREKNIGCVVTKHLAEEE
jgi:hypothetical protein